MNLVMSRYAKHADSIVYYVKYPTMGGGEYRVAKMPDGNWWTLDDHAETYLTAGTPMQLGDKSDGYLQLNENRRDGRYYEYLGHYYYKGHNIYNVNFTPTGWAIPTQPQWDGLSNMFTPKSAIVNALELKLNGQVVDWEGNTLKDKQGVDLNYWADPANAGGYGGYSFYNHDYNQFPAYTCRNAWLTNFWNVRFIITDTSLIYTK